MNRSFFGRHRKKLVTAALLLVTPPVAHVVLARATRIEPPELHVAPAPRSAPKPGLLRMGASYVRHRGKLLEVHLSGSPEQIGLTHASLLYAEMLSNEGVLWDLFERFVPSGLARVAVLDLARLRYRDLGAGIDAARRSEIAAGALGFAPDPWRDRIDTFQRFVFLNALYDISLSFERSPLIGCTSFTFSGAAAANGEALLGRAFDFEADAIFDEQKAVFFVKEDGKIPFASVAWPGLVGVVSGMNLAGLGAVVHGARAGEPQASGEPVVHALRRVLSTARTTDEAVRALGERDVMVSHVIVLCDASGRCVAVERVPGQEPFLRPLGERGVVSNHLEGPSAGDPKNLHVRETTSTLARRRRGDELAQSPGPMTVERVVAMLRDRDGAGGTPLPLGDRRAIDALIATHGVVMNTTRRVLWVSESPHLLGRFVAFDVGKLLDEGYDPEHDDTEPESVAADPLLTSGEYARQAASPRR